MKTLKAFLPARGGVPLDADWTTHVAQCKRCALFDATKPATAVNLCLEGSVLYKRDNEVRVRRAPEDRGEHYATKAEVKRAMRYRGD